MGGDGKAGDLSVTRLQEDLFMLESGLLTFGCLKSIYNECQIISYYAYVITCI